MIDWKWQPYVLPLWGLSKLCRAALAYKELREVSLETYEFEAQIKQAPDLKGAYAEVPFDIREEFGKPIAVSAGYLVFGYMRAYW